MLSRYTCANSLSPVALQQSEVGVERFELPNPKEQIYSLSPLTIVAALPSTF